MRAAMERAFVRRASGPSVVMIWIVYWVATSERFYCCRSRARGLCGVSRQYRRPLCVAARRHSCASRVHPRVRATVVRAHHSHRRRSGRVSAPAMDNVLHCRLGAQGSAEDGKAFPIVHVPEAIRRTPPRCHDPRIDADYCDCSRFGGKLRSRLHRRKFAWTQVNSAPSRKTCAE